MFRSNLSFILSLELFDKNDIYCHHKFIQVRESATLIGILVELPASCNFRIMFKSGPGTISPSISQPRVKTAGTFYPGYSGKHQIIREAIYHSSPLSLGSSRARLFITTFYMVITDYVISKQTSKHVPNSIQYSMLLFGHFITIITPFIFNPI